MKKLSVILLAFTFSLPAAANETTTASPSYTKLFFSAYTFPALNIWMYSTPLLIGARLYREDTVHHDQKEIAKNRSLRHTSYVGDLGGQMYTNLTYVLATGTMGLMGDDATYANAKAMFWASAMSGLVAQILKHAVREERPRFQSKPNEPRAKVSFPSGHTTSAFAFASVVQQFHGWAWGAPAYGFAAFVGYSRMNDNQHYLHDVIFGAILGATYGVGVSHLYKKPGITEGKFLVEPTPEGLLYTYNWTF